MQTRSHGTAETLSPGRRIILERDASLVKCNNLSVGQSTLLVACIIENACSGEILDRQEDRTGLVGAPHRHPMDGEIQTRVSPDVTNSEPWLFLLRLIGYNCDSLEDTAEGSPLFPSIFHKLFGRNNKGHRPLSHHAERDRDFQLLRRVSLAVHELSRCTDGPYRKGSTNQTNGNNFVIGARSLRIISISTAES